jgi:monoamine oxidase
VILECDACIVGAGFAGLTAARRLVEAGKPAGTETASLSHGAVDGAVRSGERGALEILESS